MLFALVSASLIGLTAGYLGSLMVTKKMGLSGGPLGHLALPGVALALMYHFNPFLGALLSIILGGILVWLIQNKTQAPMEAITGFVFTLGVSLGFWLLPFKNSEELEKALVGNINQINFSDTLLVILFSLLVIFIISRIYPGLILMEISENLAKNQGINIKRYNLLFLTAITLIVALQVKLVGGLLPIALIVIPALTARNFAKTLKSYTLGSAFVGLSSGALGVYLSYLLNLKSGLLIILVASSFFFLSLLWKKN